MPHIASTIKRTVLIAVALVMVNVPAAAVFAEDAVPPATCTAPSDADPGVHHPTGADAVAFTYQCEGPYAGQWLSAYYVYNPATNSETPLPGYEPTYNYDCAQKQWYVSQWNYSPVRNTYHYQTVASAAPSGMATGCPVVTPPAPQVVDPATIDPNKTVDTNGDGILDSPTTPETLALAQANGGSAINLDGTLNTTITNGTTAAMNNGLISYANTGNALVTGNTTGGSATSGNAQAISNIINMLQSSSNILNAPDMVLFTANINGDVNGDLLLDPAKLGSVQPSSVSSSLDNNLKINNSVDATMNNNVVLGANSGNATVTGNTTGGDATTGNADAVANIVNILNSAVTAGRSFMGVININGNLNGDILLPPNFVDTLLASNVPHYTVNTANLTNTVTVNNDVNQSINNNVNATATSGSANVGHNTTGGNATTGLANTNLEVFNLTGSNVIASNDLLVFVNVLGTWYGMIMNAPAGTTAASLGGGVSSNTTVTNDATLDNKAKEAINNNITVNANSGNASVNNNTTGGNARSGDANASVNILNMINNSLSLNGWFGLLFINVYGTWNGSFGVNTSAGDPVANASNGEKGQSNGGGTAGQMFQFVSVTPGGSNATTTYSRAAASSSTAAKTNDGVVLAAKAIKKAATTVSDEVTPVQKAVNHMILPAVGAGLAILILLAGERQRIFRRR